MYTRMDKTSSAVRSIARGSSGADRVADPLPWSAPPNPPRITPESMWNVYHPGFSAEQFPSRDDLEARCDQWYNRLGAQYRGLLPNLVGDNIDPVGRLFLNSVFMSQRPSTTLINGVLARFPEPEATFEAIEFDYLMRTTLMHVTCYGVVVDKRFSGAIVSRVNGRSGFRWRMIQREWDNATQRLLDLVLRRSQPGFYSDPIYWLFLWARTKMVALVYDDEVRHWTGVANVYGGPPDIIGGLGFDVAGESKASAGNMLLLLREAVAQWHVARGQ